MIANRIEQGTLLSACGDLNKKKSKKEGPWWAAVYAVAQSQT